jgi:hypothetical protein
MGGFPVLIMNAVLTGSNITIVNSGTGTIPLNTNVETLQPNLLAAYQGDNFTGPSEKTLINLKRARLLNMDIMSIIYGFFRIDGNTGLSPISFTIELVKGGFPVVVATTGTQTDWSITGGTRVVLTESFGPFPILITSNAEGNITRIMDITLNMQQRFLYFYPRNNPPAV